MVSFLLDSSEKSTITSGKRPAKEQITKDEPKTKKISFNTKKPTFNLKDKKKSQPTNRASKNCLSITLKPVCRTYLYFCIKEIVFSLHLM